MLKTAQTRLLPQYIGIGEPSLIRPLCAPIMPDDSFGTDVAGRYSERVYSLWKRLSLVYAEEGVQAAAPEKPPVIVNSFTSRVLVQLFAGNQFNRLVKYDQPNSVFSTKFSAAAKTEKKRAAAELVRYISERTELTAALEDFGRTLSGTASERGAFVALAALSRISAGKLTDGGRRAVEALSAAISETDGAAAQTAAELSRAADERTAQELGEKLTELTRRYSAAAEKNRALSAAVEYAKELIESGSAEKAAPEAISRAALERFDKRCGVQGAAAERLRALSERTEQGGLPAGEGAARVISAQRQARAGLMGAEAETAALAAGVLAGRAAAYPAYSAGALLPVTANIGSADVPTARTRAGEPLVYAQDSVQAEGAQAFGADIAASVARRVVKAAGLMSAGSPNSAVGGSAAGSGAASAVGAANAGVGGSAAAVGAMAAQRAVGAESILSRASRNIADKSAPERRAVRGAGSESAANAAQYAGLAGSGAGGFYRVLSEYAQTAQLRKIAQSSSFLFGEAFARNGENGSDGATGADGTNAARGIDGTNGANATPATPAKGTVLPVEAAHGALSRAGEVVFAQNGENGANGSDGATGADGTNGVRGIDGTNGTNAAPAKGTVLPVEATRGALSRAGEVVFAQNGENGANGSDGATGADGANAAPATLAKGTVLPVEATRGALSSAGEVVFAQNGENGANGSDGSNGANATPAKGTVLPVEATRGMLSRTSEVVFAQNGENGANGSDGVTGADGANGARGNDGLNGTNDAPATPAKGTVLPVEAAHGALSRAGEVVFAQNGENGSDGTNGARGIDGTNGAASANSSTARKAGRILPAGGTVRAAAGPHKPQSTADSGISRAVMDRLDPQTASALAGLVREAKGAGQGAVYTARIVPAQTEHGAQELSYAQTEGGISQAADSGGGISANAMRIMLMNLRTAALSRKHTELRTQNVSRHNQNVILSANAPARKYDAPYLAMRSAVTFRTTESADIVMLAPPVEMDRFSAESGYSRQMPPIEFKQREEAPAPPAPPPAAKPKAVSKTTEQIVRTQLPKGLDGLSYAEISRLADKVYAQIEARLNRERIRRGL